MEQERNVKAVRLAVKHYWQQVLYDWYLAGPALILPGIGNILGFYVPPLIVAKILANYAGGTHPTIGNLIPYIALFAGLWLVGEALWRIAIAIAQPSRNPRYEASLYTGYGIFIR